MSGAVLVTSAQERFALAACRTLHAAGYRVGAVADQRPAATHWSRRCHARYTLVDAKEDAERFVAGLADIVGSGGYDVLLPATDAALLAVSARRERLEPHVRLGLPAHEVVDRATDKLALDDAARTAGFHAPHTVVCHTPEDALAAADRLGFPLVVKPRRTAFALDGAVRQRGSMLVPDREALEAAAGGFGSPFVLQRVVPGDVLSVAGVRTPDGGVLSFSVARYVRTWPVRAGNVAFAETVPATGDLRERVDAMLAALGWHGLFEVELVRGAAGDHVIDLNPRLYGSLAHAGRAGAPHAVIFTDWVLGRPVGHVTARPGVRYRWEDADARCLVHALRAREFAHAVRIARPRRDVAHAYGRRDDPGPLVARGLLLAREASARLVASRGPGSRRPGAA